MSTTTAASAGARTGTAWIHTVQTVQDGVYRIRMDRPEKLNAFINIILLIHLVIRLNFLVLDVKGIFG